MLGWLAPLAQIRHIEILTHGYLCWLLARHHDGRPKFEALNIFDFVFALGGLIAERTGHSALYLNIFYLGALCDIPLWYLAAQEAADWRPFTHRAVLFAWMAFTVGCMSIRYFPYSGFVLLIGNTVFYLAWIVQKRRTI